PRLRGGRGRANRRARPQRGREDHAVQAPDRRAAAACGHTAGERRVRDGAADRALASRLSGHGARRGPAREHRAAAVVGEAGARAWDRVLCLNRHQVAFGPPGETLTLPVLEETYGAAIVELESGALGVVPPHHHEEAR